MKPRLDLAALRSESFAEHTARFVFGGLVTVAAGLVAHAFGPRIGGFFLAFPAILPATLTLLKRHKGRREAGLDALGACFGAVGTAAFALVVWRAPASLAPPWVLALATLAWAVTSVTGWAIRYAWRPTPASGDDRGRAMPSSARNDDAEDVGGR